MDIADRAEIEEERFITESIRRARQTTNKLVANGECHYCGEEVEKPKLFCNRDCSFDHEREEKMRTRLGKLVD